MKTSTRLVPYLVIVIFAVSSLLTGLPAQGKECWKQDSNAADDKALAQVLIHGLAVLYWEPSRENPARATVYFGNVTNHEVAISTGNAKAESSFFSWTEVHRTDGDCRNAENNCSYRGASFEILTDEDFCVNRSGDPPNDQSDFPANADSARNAGWMLHALDLEDEVSLMLQESNARVFIHGGAIETCSLVTDEYYCGACRMKRRGLSTNFERVLSESIVVRFEVDRDECDSERDLLSVSFPDGNHQTIAANPIDTSVKWGEKEYNCVYDLQIRNTPPPESGERTMRSDHGSHLKDMFEGTGPFRSWDVKAVKNPESDEFSCMDGVQPTCWQHFRAYAPQAEDWSDQGQDACRPGYIENPPACPIVDYP